MPVVSAWLRRVAVLVALSALCLSAISCTTAQTGSSGAAPSLGGKWRFTLTPKYSYDISAHKASTDATPAVVEVWLYDYDGAVIGWAGPWHFNGIVDDGQLRMTVSQAGGPKDVSAEGQLSLKIDSGTKMSGTSLVDDVGFEHRGLSVASVSAERIGDAPAIKSLGSPDWTDAIVGWLVDWIAKINVFKSAPLSSKMFQGGSVVHNGAGYYMMGDHGPGAEREFFTYTSYYALDWGRFGTKDYKFTIHSGDKRTTPAHIVEQLRASGQDAAKCFGYRSVDKLVADYQDFYNKYGDFAISCAYSWHSGNLAIYVNLKDASKAKEAVNHPLVQAIKNNLVLTTKDGVKHDCAVLAGGDISDKWHLDRSAEPIPLPGMPPNCVYFYYMLGTIEVHYD